MTDQSDPKFARRDAPRPKTYKREVAIVMLCFLAGFFVWGVFNGQSAESARFLTLPIFTFAGGAFGLDAWAQQLGSQAKRGS